jgi:hypothetical protein
MNTRGQKEPQQRNKMSNSQGPGETDSVEPPGGWRNPITST